MSGANSFKFVLLPLQSETTRDWANRLAEIVPEARVIVAEGTDAAARELVDAQAAFGWLSSDLLLKASPRVPGHRLLEGPFRRTRASVQRGEPQAQHLRVRLRGAFGRASRAEVAGAVRISSDTGRATSSALPAGDGWLLARQCGR